MKPLEKIRNSILAIVVLTTAIALLKNTVSDRSTLPVNLSYSFPEKVDLQNWTFLGSDRTAVQHTIGPALESSTDANTIAAQVYRYRRGQTEIAIEMRYLTSEVHVPVILQELTLLRTARSLRENAIEPFGTYAIYTQNHKPSLTSCIASHGRASVQYFEFQQNQNHPAVLSDRFFPWLIGKAPMRDYRCLWINISARSPQLTITELETVWINWVKPWRDRFPQEPTKPL